MSSMIKCDGCNALMYADSRTPKGAYHEVWIDSQYKYHLCKTCYDAMMQNIFKRKWNEDEAQYVGEDDEE